MPEYTDLFFDLDGTLTDSGPGIMNALAYAFRRAGKAVPGREVLRRFVGPPLLESYQRFGGLTEQEARECIELYREYYSGQGLFENALYPGIPALLARLKGAGRRLAVATGKPEVYARRIAEHFGIAAYFDLVAGAAMDETRSSKEEVIRYAMERLGISEPGAVLMIGDREHDVLGAKRCGMDCMGVLYGYGDREELERAGARYIARDAEDIGHILLDGGI